MLKKYKEIKIPFRPNKPLDMNEVFVPLKVIDHSVKNQMDVLNAISKYKKLVIIGAPGSGKSMLCKNILFNHGVDHLNINKLPILLELHRLNSNKTSIEDLLEDELARNDFPNSKSFIAYNLKHGNLLLLFDGFDEVNSKEKTRVTNALNDFIDLYEKCNLLITSRTMVYKNEFVDCVNQTLELVEFNHQQIRMYLKSWEKTMPQGKSVDQLMLALQDRPNIMQMATNPLMLTIIAYLYTDTVYHVLPHSRGEFYKNATDVLLDIWDVSRNLPNIYEKIDKELLLRNLALEIQDNSVNQPDDRKIISARKIKEVFQRILPNLNLKAEDFSPILKEIVERSGLLIKIDGGENYQFAHLTLQEYYSAQLLSENREGLLKRFKQDNYLWAEPLKLWCGLSTNATKMIQDVFEINTIIAFDCLADARSVDEKTSKIILAHFQNLLTEPNDKSKEIAKAFGSLAANRKKGRGVFDYLEEQLRNTTDKGKLKIIADALSFTYLPAAAKVIGAKYKSCREIHENLVRMGDISIPAFEEMTKSEFKDSLFGLYQIGTPKAALKLADHIWEDNEKAVNAAWLLADLLKISTIEETLQKISVSPESKKLSVIEWIWKPFNKIVNSSIYFIIGRIAFLIGKNPKEYPYKLEIDKRIAIPISIVRFESLSENEREIFNSYFLKKNLDKYNTSPVKNNLAYENLFNNFPKDFLENLLIKFAKMKPTKNDWLNISKPIEYDITRGWHYIVGLVFFAILTISSLGYCGFLLFNSNPFFTKLNVIQLICGILVVFNLINYYFFEVSGTSFKPGENNNVLHFHLVGVFGSIVFPGILIVSIYQYIKYKDKDKDKYKDEIIIKDKATLIYVIKISTLIVWAPFICFYNIQLMNLYLNSVQIISVGIGIIILWSLLFWRASYLERKANNPLKGLVNFKENKKQVSIRPSLFGIKTL